MIGFWEGKKEKWKRREGERRSTLTGEKRSLPSRWGKGDAPVTPLWTPQGGGVTLSQTILVIDSINLSQPLPPWLSLWLFCLLFDFWSQYSWSFPITILNALEHQIKKHPIIRSMNRSISANCSLSYQNTHQLEHIKTDPNFGDMSLSTASRWSQPLHALAKSWKAVGQLQKGINKFWGFIY